MATRGVEGSRGRGGVNGLIYSVIFTDCHFDYIESYS